MNHAVPWSTIRIIGDVISSTVKKFHTPSYHIQTLARYPIKTVNIIRFSPVGRLSLKQLESLTFFIHVIIIYFLLLFFLCGPARTCFVRERKDVQHQRERDQSFFHFWNSMGLKSGSVCVCVQLHSHAHSTPKKRERIRRWQLHTKIFRGYSSMSIQ